MQRRQFTGRGRQRVLKTGGVELVARQPGQRRRCGVALLARGRRFFGRQRQSLGFISVAPAFQAAQLEHRPVQVHQGRKKCLALARLLAQQLQTGLQLAEQLRQHSDQLGRLAQGDLAFDAPQQIGHDRAKAQRVDLLARVAQPGMRHRQRPGAEQKIQHQTRYLVEVRTRAQGQRNLVGQRLALLGKTQRLQRVLAQLRVLPVLPIPAVLQRRQRQLKRPRIFNGLAVERVEGDRHRLEKSQKIGAELIVVLEAALRHALQQAASGVALVAEKARVAHRQAQQRRLQRDDGFAQRRQQPRVLRNLSHQLAHHLQAQHLADLPGVFFKLRAHDGALARPAKDAPQLLAQRAALVDKAAWPLGRRQAAVVRRRRLGLLIRRRISCCGGRRRRRLARRFQRRQLFLNGGVVSRCQAMVRPAAAMEQKVLQQFVLDTVVGQVGVMRGRPRHRLVRQIAARASAGRA